MAPSKPLYGSLMASNRRVILPSHIFVQQLELPLPGVGDCFGPKPSLVPIQVTEITRCSLRSCCPAVPGPTPGRAGPTVSARDSGGFAGGGRPSHLRPPPPAFDEWNVGVLMKAKSPSVLRCITMATDCGQRAAIAATEADMMRELEMAVTWLEMAKAQAQSGDPSVWAEGLNNGQTSGGS